MLVGLLAILLSSNIFQLYKNVSISKNVNITIYVVSNDFQIIYMSI